MNYWGERQRKAKRRERMKNNPYKDLPPLECRPDGSLYRMTPAPVSYTHLDVYKRQR